MCLLRMLAFSPTQNTDTTQPKSAAQANPKGGENPPQTEKPAKVTTIASEPTSAEKKTDSQLSPTIQNNTSITTDRVFDGNWRNLVDQLKLGLARALAQNCELVKHDENNIYLTIPQTYKHLLDQGYQDKLKAVIEHYFGKRMQLHFEVGGTGNTPAQQVSQEKAALQSKAETAIQEDRFVQALVNEFGAQIISSSIKPVQ